MRLLIVILFAIFFAIFLIQLRLFIGSSIIKKVGQPFRWKKSGDDWGAKNSRIQIG